MGEDPFSSIRKGVNNPLEMLYLINPRDGSPEVRPDVKKCVEMPLGMVVLMEDCWEKLPLKRPSGFSAIIDRLLKCQKEM